MSGDNVPVAYEDEPYVAGLRDLGEIIRTDKTANWLAVANVLDDAASMIESRTIERDEALALSRPDAGEVGDRLDALPQPLSQKVPDRLWLHDLGGGDITWCGDPDPDGEQIASVEYVRADAYRANQLRATKAAIMVDLDHSALVEALTQARNDLLEVGNDYPGSSCQKWCTERAAAVWSVLKPWQHCPSTHCERAQECRSINECSAEKRTLNRVNSAALAELIVDTADHPEPAAQALTTLAAEKAALDWFGTQRNCELDFHGRTYGDDDEPDLWRVSRWTGSINDRECETVAHGATPLEAIANARAALEGNQP